jgi:hypothetical protein
MKTPKAQVKTVISGIHIGGERQMSLVTRAPFLAQASQMTSSYHRETDSMAEKLWRDLRSLQAL